LTRAELRGVADAHHGQLGRLDLEHGDVGALVQADDLGRVLATVGHADRDFGRVVDDMRVGEDVTVGADDEARALAPRRGAVAALPATRDARHAEAAEELIERIVGRHARGGRGLALADDGDIDHGGPEALDEAGEIRERQTLPGSGGRDDGRRGGRRGGGALRRFRRLGCGRRGLRRTGREEKHSQGGAGGTPRERLGRHAQGSSDESRGQGGCHQRHCFLD